jgi:DNA-binding MarR family transcriptional regulator
MKLEQRTMKKSSKTSRKASGRSTTDVIPDFDDEGLRLAILAALECLYECFPHITLPQYLIALEVRRAESEGTPHTLASLVKKLKMPFSTASRVVWSLTEDGGEIGVIRYQSHPTDRRKKHLVINRKNLPNEIPAAVTRAMLAYYGDSVRQLKRASQ